MLDETSNIDNKSQKQALVLTDDKNHELLNRNMNNESPIKWDVKGMRNSIAAINLVRNKKKMKRYQVVIICMGIQEMMEEKVTSEKVQENLVQAARILSSYGIKVYLSQPLPANVEIGISRALSLCRLISKQKPMGLMTVLLLNELQMYSKAKTVEGDSFVLTEFGAKHCSDIIKSNVVVPESEDKDLSEDSDSASSDDDDDEEYIIVVKVTSQRMKFVIGTDGATVRDIQSKTGTSINKMNFTDGEERVCGFMVKGQKNNVKLARKSILSIAKGQDRRSKENTMPATQKRSLPLCRYFRQGKCQSGSYCNFSHEAAPKRGKNI